MEVIQNQVIGMQRSHLSGRLIIQQRLGSEVYSSSHPSSSICNNMLSILFLRGLDLPRGPQCYVDPCPVPTIINHMCICARHTYIHTFVDQKISKHSSFSVDNAEEAKICDRWNQVVDDLVRGTCADE